MIITGTLNRFNPLPMSSKAAILAKIDYLICSHPRPNEFAARLLQLARTRSAANSLSSQSFPRSLICQAYAYLADLLFCSHLSKFEEYLLVIAICDILSELEQLVDVSVESLLNDSTSHTVVQLSSLSAAIYYYYLDSFISTPFRFFNLRLASLLSTYLIHKPLSFVFGSIRRLIYASFKLIPLSVGNLSQRIRAHRSLRLARPIHKESSSLSIGIVIPSFNHSEFIEDTLSSLYSQNYRALFVHVQDGCSTDGTLQILQKYASLYPHSFSYRVEPDSGQSDAINRGFRELPSTDLMAWLNSDDIYLPGLLATYSSFFSAHPNVDIVYSDRLLIDTNSKVVGRWQLPSHRDTDLLYAFWVPQETMMWRRSAWDVIGSSLDSTLNFAIDWDLCLRFFRKGLRFVHLPFVFGALRVHPSQKSQSIIGDTGLYEMDVVRLNHDVRVLSRNSLAHKYYLLGFYLRQKTASLLSLLRARLSFNYIVYVGAKSSASR